MLSFIICYIIIMQLCEATVIVMFNRSRARVLILNAACKSQAKTRDIISPKRQ